MPVLESYFKNAKIIQATERLSGVMVNALGAGAVSEEDSGPILDQWERDAGISKKPKKRVKMSEYGAAMAGAMGVGVTVNKEPKKVTRVDRDDLISLTGKKEE